MSTTSSSHIGDERIRAQLATLQDAFQPSLQKGGDVLASFNKSLDEFLHRCGADILHEETHFMIYSFVQVVNTISSAVLESVIASDAVHQELDKEIEEIAETDLKRLSIEDVVPGPATSNRSPYIEPCYKWLLGHLHNPYPSRDVRSLISRQTGAQVKDIDSWFVDARKRIGWNDLRKAQFESRANMVKAAAQFFQPLRRPLRHTPYNRPTKEQLDRTDYSPEFASIEDRARNLYSDKFFPTALATELSAKEVSSHSTSLVGASKSANMPADPALSYPSPARSPSSSLDRMSLPSLQDTTPMRNWKRKNSSVEPEARSESESYPRPHRPLKRSRINNSQAVEQDAIASLPSPAASIQGLPTESLSSPPAASSPHDATSPAPPPKRQRSPSDTDDEQSPHKRQRHLSNTNDEHLSSSPSPPFPTSDILPFVVQTSSISSSQERDHPPTEGPNDLASKDSHNALTNALLLSTAFPLPSSTHNVSFASASPVQPAISVSSSSQPSTPSTPPIPVNPAANSTKRKRRLSDADDQMRAKRPHNAMVTPRHQTVSDPFPISKPADSDSFAHWWRECIQTGQEIDMAKTPMPVVETLDESTPLDVHYETYNYTDLASSIPDFNQWTDYTEPLMGASLSFPDTPVDQPFTSASQNMGIQLNLPDFGNIPFKSHDSVYNTNANEFSAPYSNTSLFLPDTIDQTTGMPLFADLNLAESWTFDEFIPSPQLFESNIPQFTHDFTSTIPQSHDALAYADKLAKQRRVERLQEELRLAQAELAS